MMWHFLKHYTNTAVTWGQQVDPAPSYSCYWCSYERTMKRICSYLLIGEWSHSTEVFGWNVGGDDLNCKRNLWFEIPKCCSKYWEEFEILENSVITAVIRRISNWCDIQLRLYRNNYTVNILTGYCSSYEYLIDEQLSLWWYDLMWCKLICFLMRCRSIEWELKLNSDILTSVNWMMMMCNDIDSTL